MFAAIGAGLSVGAIVEGLKSAGEQVVNLAHDADKLSVSTEQLSRLRYAAKDAGVDAEQLSKAMSKAQETIGKAAAEGGEAAKTLGHFGINVNALKDLSPDKQFTAIADAISKIHNPSERAAAEVAAFGKSGMELGPLLEQGSAGIAAMSSEADRLGISVSSVDAENTLRASLAVDKVEEAVAGLGQQIASRLAPFVEEAANKMLAWAETGDHVGQIIRGAIEGISYGVAFLSDLWVGGRAAIEAFGGGAYMVLAGLTESVNLFAKGGAYLIEKVFGTKIDTSAIDAAADHLLAKSQELYTAAGKDASDVYSGATAAKVFTYFDDIQAKANQTSKVALQAHEGIVAAFSPPEAKEGKEKIDDVTKALEELAKQSRQVGMTEGQTKIDDLYAMHAGPAAIAAATLYLNHIEAVNKAKAEGKRLDDEAKSAIEDSLTPLQKEQQKIAELQKLYDSGRLSKEQFNQARLNAEAELHGEAHNTQGSVTRGSQEAFKLMNEINNRAHKNPLEDLAKKQVAAAEKHTTLLEKIGDKLGISSGLAMFGIGD